MGLETVNDRTQWAIDYIIRKEHLSNVKLADKMGFSPGAINSYRTKQTTPNIEFVLKFCEIFGFSLLWFVDGWGWPFKGAQETHPESLGPNPKPSVPDWPGISGPDADKPFVPVMDLKNIINAQHDEIIRQFKDRETAKEINAGLLYIESVNRSVFREVSAYIKGVVNGLKAVSGEQAPGAKKSVNE